MAPNKYTYQDPFTISGKAVEVEPEDTTEDGRVQIETVPEQVENENTETESVPTGSTKEVLDWVGDDKDRARLALDEEESKGKDGRKGLKNELHKILDES